jgi:hypothetical protein
MQTFKDYIRDAGLTIFDIDETLFSTTAKILVKDGQGVVVQSLSNQEFNTHKLKTGHEYDFKQFSDSNLFRKTSKPNHKVIHRINFILKAIEKAERDSKVIFLTVRAPFDDHGNFLQTFREHGVNIDKIDIITTSGKPKNPVIEKYLDTGKYSRVRLYDDHIGWLDDFMSLSKLDKYKNIQFTPYHIINGKIKKYG